jgi:hypothetical protein
MHIAIRPQAAATCKQKARSRSEFARFISVMPAKITPTRRGR